MRDRKGLALLVVVGVLGILAVLAAAFVTMAQLERRASQQRMARTKAALLARSGIEDALARLSAGQDPEAASARYGGENWDGDTVLSSREAASEVYKPTGVGTPPDTDVCPVRHAMRPSFWAAKAGAPDLLTVDGRERGYSGKLSGDRGKDGNLYATKVTSGGFHVNGGDPARPATEGYNDVLRRMLGTLAEALDRETGGNDLLPVDQLDGERLMTMRPDTGWKNWHQVRDLALGGSQAKLDALRPYLALHAWVDGKVIRPNAVLGVNTEPKSWASIRLAHSSYPGDPVPDFERLPVLPGGRIVGRAPVDFSWARTRRPALLALLSGLRGLALNETTAEGANWTGKDILGSFVALDITNNWLPTDPAYVIANAILTSTTEIRTWDAFNAFCDAIPLPGNVSIARVRKDILKANFNPNSDLNKFNPDISLARLVDKSDLLTRSTEFSLLPLGCGHISVEGRILDAGGRLLASAVLGADLEGDRMLRLTTQREFVAGALGAPDVAGDEGLARGYGDAPYITPSQGGLNAFGHKLFGGSGMSLQSLPEPHTAPPASYDGQLRLATLETGDGQDGPTMMFLARWDDGFDADYTGDNGSLALATPYDALQSTPDLSLWNPIRPNTLHTDGIYLEQDRQPGYYCMGNMAAQRGTLSFWVKPHFDVAQSSGVLPLLKRKHLFLNATRMNAGGESAAFFLTHTRAGEDPRGFGFALETGFGADNANPEMTIGLERIVYTPSRTDPPHRWQLVTMRWNELETVPGEVVDLRIDSGQGVADRSSEYNYAWVDFTNQNIDYRMPDGPTLTSAVFHLGRRGNESALEETMVTDHSPPDATFDEFAIYDFGLAGPAGLATAALISNRWADGRFYKESGYSDLLDLMGDNTAGRWFSAPVDLGAVRLKRLAWTQIVPAGLRAPLEPGPDGRVVLELADAAGLDYLKDSGGTPVARLRTRPDGEWLDRRISSAFRFHAVFQPNLDPATMGDTPILDPLALDDVTVTYERPGGARILGWAQE